MPIAINHAKTPARGGASLSAQAGTVALFIEIIAKPLKSFIYDMRRLMRR